MRCFSFLSQSTDGSAGRDFWWFLYFRKSALLNVSLRMPGISRHGFCVLLLLLGWRHVPFIHFHLEAADTGKERETERRQEKKQTAEDVILRLNSPLHKLTAWPRLSAGGQTTQQPQDWGEWEDEVWILASPLDSSAILYEILHPFQPPFPHLWNDVSFLLPPQVYHKDPLSYGCENMLQSVRFPHKCEAFLSITIWQMQSLVLLTQLSFTALGNLDFAYKLGKGGNICL